MPGHGSIGGKSIGGSGFLNLVKIGITYLSGLYQSLLALVGSSDNNDALAGTYDPEIALTGLTNSLEPLDGEYKKDIPLSGLIKD